MRHFFLSLFVFSTTLSKVGAENKKRDAGTVVGVDLLEKGGNGDSGSSNGSSGGSPSSGTGSSTGNTFPTAGDFFNTTALAGAVSGANSGPTSSATPGPSAPTTEELNKALDDYFNQAYNAGYLDFYKRSMAENLVPGPLPNLSHRKPMDCPAKIKSMENFTKKNFEDLRNAVGQEGYDKGSRDGMKQILKGYFDQAYQAGYLDCYKEGMEKNLVQGPLPKVPHRKSMDYSPKIKNIDKEKSENLEKIFEDLRKTVGQEGYDKGYGECRKKITKKGTRQGKVSAAKEIKSIGGKS